MPINKHNITGRFITGIRFLPVNVVEGLFVIRAVTRLKFQAVNQVQKLIIARMATCVKFATTVYIPQISDWILRTGKWKMDGSWRMTAKWKMQ